MGILNGNEICEELCNRSLLYSIPSETKPDEPKPDANLYIDGPILLYCGNIQSEDIGISVSLGIINSKLKKIKSIVSTYYNVIGVHVFFDGEAPPEKAHRQAQRASRNSRFNVQEVKKAFCAFGHSPSIAINKLEKGEAEMEMYKMRNKQTTSVIYTKDTDMFTIAYGHSTTDDVIYCQERVVGGERMYKFYDMRKFFYPNITPEVFSALMAFAGTDYTETRLSLTQIKCILSESDSLPLNVISVDPKIEEIHQLVHVIDNFFRTRHYKGRDGVTESRKYKFIREEEYLKIVWWYVRYIKYGFNGC